MGMDQYLLIPFLGGWTSIYQLFWCELQGYYWFWHTAIWNSTKILPPWLSIEVNSCSCTVDIPRDATRSCEAHAPEGCLLLLERCHHRALAGPAGARFLQKMWPFWELQLVTPKNSIEQLEPYSLNALKVSCSSSRWNGCWMQFISSIHYHPFFNFGIKLCSLVVYGASTQYYPIWQPATGDFLLYRKSGPSPQYIY